MYKPEEEVRGPPPGMVTRNRKLEARLKRNTDSAMDGSAMDKAKKGAPPVAKKEEPPKKDPKAKGGPTEEELQAEADRLKREAEEEE